MRETTNGHHQIPSPGAGTNGLAWRGTSLWSVEGVGPIHEINPETGEVLLTLTPPYPGGAGLEWAGEHLWYNSIWQQTFYKLSIPDLEVVTTFSSPAARTTRIGMGW